MQNKLINYKKSSINREVTQLLKNITNQDLEIEKRILAGNLISKIGDPRIIPYQPALVKVAGGQFIMGSTLGEIHQAANEYTLPKDWFLKEYPKRRVYLDTFYIMKYLVTNLEYKLYIDDNEGNVEIPKYWNGKSIPDLLDNHPVWDISFEASCKYANWLSKKSGIKYKLPSEEQWEKAARGTNGKIYPWGDVFNSEYCNTKEGDIGGTTPIGIYPKGISSYGCMDMAGNVEEWTATLFSLYPNNPYPNQETDQVYYVTRGGAWNKRGDTARCARRHGPLFRNVQVGIRLVTSNH